MSGFLKTLILLLAAQLFIACSDEALHRPGLTDCNLENDTLWQTNSDSPLYTSILRKYTKRGIPGITLLVCDSSGIFIGSEGYADLSSRLPLQPCHISNLPGITDMMLAVTALRLMEKGLMTPDDSIGRFIPDELLKKLDNGKQQIKIRNLLNQTSGFFDVTRSRDFQLNIMQNPVRTWFADELLDFAENRDAAFEFRPADTAGYSATNSILLSIIVAQASHIPHDLSMRSELFSPLNMNNTRYYWHDALPASGVVQGYGNLNGDGGLENISHWNTGFGNGFNGIYSNIYDVYLFADALFSRKVLLSPATLGLMTQFHNDTIGGIQYGYGCVKEHFTFSGGSTPAWGISGADPGYSAGLYYFPVQDAIMVYIINTGYGLTQESTISLFRNSVAEIIGR